MFGFVHAEGIIVFENYENSQKCNYIFEKQEALAGKKLKSSPKTPETGQLYTDFPF